MSDFSLWDEARRGEHTFFGAALPPPPQPSDSTGSQTGWGQVTYKNSLTPERAHCYVYMLDGFSLHILSRMMMNRPPDRDVAPTQRLPQNSLWLMQALQATRTAQTGTQHPPDAAWTGGTSTLAPNTKMRICSCHQASSYFDETSTLPYKHSTYI